MSSETKTVKSRPAVDSLFKTGAHFGYSRSRLHPSVQPFIFGFKNRGAIIDLEKSADLFEQAKTFIASVAASGKKILLVGTKPEARGAVEATALELNLPYVSGRWLGGTLTNFPEIKKRMQRLTDLKEDKAKGGFARFTKREQSRLDKELSDLERHFGTITELKEFPGAIVVIDSREEEIAAIEGRKVGVPIVSLSGTDCDLSQVDYPVVGNDATIATIKHFLTGVKEAYRAGLSPKAALV